MGLVEMYRCGTDVKTLSTLFNLTEEEVRNQLSVNPFEVNIEFKAIRIEALETLLYKCKQLACSV